MPFRTQTTFPERPDVQIFFHGLLLLCPDGTGSECRVGVHRLSVEHKLSVEVRVKGTDPPDPPLLRLGGTLDSLGLSIAVDPPTANGVSKFVKSEDDIDRLDETNDARDFRWSVDLQSLDPQQPPLLLEQSGVSPGIVIKDGLFYTARRTEPDTIRVLLIDAGNAPKPLNRVARIIGSNIYLEDGQRVVLRWFGEGKVQELVLPKTDGDNSFLIYIDNSPSLMPSGKPTHSEFQEYFKVITNATRPFDLDFDVVGIANSSNDRAPCMSVVVGG